MLSETGEPLNGQLTHNLLEWQLFGPPDNKSERYHLPAGQEGRKQGRKHDGEKFFHLVVIRKGPPNVCVALTDLCGFPCIVGEVEIEYD